MTTTKTRARRAVSTLAGLGVVTSMAAPMAAVAVEEAQAPEALPTTGATAHADVALAQSQLVEVPATGVFAYDQTAVSSKADLARLGTAARVLCGARDATSYADPLAWEITVSGDVRSEFTATIEDLAGERSVNQLMTCSCGGNPAGGRAIATADVKGIPVEHLLARAGASADATTVTFVGADGTRVSMPLGYAIGHHAVLSCELNGEDLAASVGGSNQLWLAKTPANYFVRDVVEIIVSTDDEVDIPPAPGSQDEHPNSPNVGILAASVM